MDANVADQVSMMRLWRSGDRSVYDEYAIDVYKALRADGIPVIWDDRSEDRFFLQQRSAEIVSSIALGVATNFISDALKAALAKFFGAESRSAKKVTLTISRRRLADGTTEEVLRIDGTGEEIARLLESGRLGLGADQ